jgi:hypothetical protein
MSLFITTEEKYQQQKLSLHECRRVPAWVLLKIQMLTQVNSRLSSLFKICIKPTYDNE